MGCGEERKKSRVRVGSTAEWGGGTMARTRVGEVMVAAVKKWQWLGEGSTLPHQLTSDQKAK